MNIQDSDSFCYIIRAVLKLKKKRAVWPNVIKLRLKTRLGLKMESETAWEKALCRLFLCASKKKAYSKQSGWNIR
ncbi:hypothetical protein ABE504_24560, partial [Paenibacillus oryzisoli]|uniref:hypothetical protein n=1 Tax=Paenibacillus oryzisoli TaxID=1850517 RepID=UPI003D2A6192